LQAILLQPQPLLLAQVPLRESLEAQAAVEPQSLQTPPQPYLARSAVQVVATEALAVAVQLLGYGLRLELAGESTVEMVAQAGLVQVEAVAGQPSSQSAAQRLNSQTHAEQQLGEAVAAVALALSSSPTSDKEN
jgi:Flp pilus assembly protein TadG